MIELAVPFGALFQVMALTGVRLREAAFMRRDELADGVWTIPGTRTKNGRSLTLELPKLALDVIDSLPMVSNQYVFSTNGRSPVSGFSKAKKALDRAIGPIPEWRLHDLRRSFASGLAKLGVALPVIERLLESCQRKASAAFKASTSATSSNPRWPTPCSVGPRTLTASLPEKPTTSSICRASGGDG